MMKQEDKTTPTSDTFCRQDQSISKQETTDWNSTKVRINSAQKLTTQIALSHFGISDHKEFFFLRSSRHHSGKRCPPPVVPIPGTTFLLGPGLIGLASIRRKLNKDIRKN
jgi:hypothetical protein